MLDDLRRDINEGDDLFDDVEEDEYDDVIVERSSTLFLGMTPVERMFLSIFLFMNVTVLGLALLLATGRIG